MGEVISESGRGLAGEVVRHVDVDMVDPGRFQTRRHFDSKSLEELAQSIRTSGVVQPIVVRFHVNSGRYEIIAGERRWRAAQIAQEYQIPALVRDDMDDRACLIFAVAENIQRESLSPIEEAASFQRMSEELGMRHEDVAEAVGKSRTYVTNLMRLLGLEPRIQEMIEEGSISPGHGKAILGAPPAFRFELAKQILRYKLSVRKAEERAGRMARDWKGEGDGQPRRDPNIVRLERMLSAHFASAIKVDYKHDEGRGGIYIPFNSLDEAHGILERMKVKYDDDG